ncbi:MAG: hypothetical protein K2X63_01365 [Burkholderiaceae bacterium]|jgi:hypothetical protein|nr:hypothetical protein [Burkholderiaceae bacterium]
MRLLLLFFAGVTVIKSIPRIRKVAVHMSNQAANTFDDVYSDVAKKVGKTAESIDDRIAERRYAVESVSHPALKR